MRIQMSSRLWLVPRESKITNFNDEIPEREVNFGILNFCGYNLIHACIPSPVLS